MTGRQKHRRRFVADARVQWILATRIILHFVLFFAVSFTLGLLLEYMTSPRGVLADHLQSMVRQCVPMLVAVVCLMPVFVHDTLKMSHRIAGPICRMRDTIRLLQAGEDAAPLTFRSNDMWEDLPHLFNRMISRLRNDQEAREVACTSEQAVSDPA